MKHFTKIFCFVALASVVFSLTSCSDDKDDNFSQSGHEYYYAYVGTANPAYYYVLDMYNQRENGIYGDFTVKPYTLDGKKLTSQTDYSGHYTRSTNRNNITAYWSHMSMATNWDYYSTGIVMSSSSNPSVLRGLNFVKGKPAFEN